MNNQPTRIPKLFLLLLALTGWFALIAQFVLHIQNSPVSAGEAVIRFFGYFTILTNLIIAICVTALLVAPASRWGQFFGRPSTLTAITVYIIIVGAVYNFILRFLWAPRGLQQVVDELLHSVIPVLFTILWILFVNKRSLHWKLIPSWLIYPILYILFVVVFGEMSGFYPYPFIDVAKLGYPRALSNGGVILVAFIVLSLLLATTGKIGKRDKS